MVMIAQPVLVVTGAAAGIGAATVARLVERGAQVVAADRDDSVRDPASGAAMARVLDVSSQSDMDALIRDTLAQFGRLDGIFNNAGILGLSVPVEDYPEDVFDRVMAVNVRGVFLGMKTAIPAMRASGGGVVLNNASTGGMVGAAHQSAYVASKHAVVGLTRSAALEAAVAGIRVNALCPGPTGTQMMRDVVDGWNAVGQDEYEALLQVTPTGRLATADEIASVAAWLLCEAPSYLTGAVIPVDGAQTAR